MELKEILKELSVFGNDRPVPVEALAEAVRQKEAITPVLLDALDTIYKKVQEKDENVYDDPSYDLSYYGIFLLAQFQEQKAFPKLLQILRLDKDGLEIMLGDLLDYMGKMLYSTYNGDLSALKSVIEDDSLDPFARGAALEVLDGIYQDGRLSHEELTDLLREQLASLGEGEDEEIFGSIVIDQIADNDLYELAEDVREAFRLEKIDTMRLGNFDGFFDYLYNETEDYHHTQLLKDTAQELDGWACFKSSKPSRMDLLDWKVGRNDPCPCGSGKKFKKCCLPKQEEMKIKFSSIDRGIDWDKYPPIDRQGSRPGLSDFYSQDAIEVDRLAYQAFTMLRHPSYQQRKGKVLKEARELLWIAFDRFQQICEAKGLKTPEEFDQEHKLHYFSREWLDVLLDQLLDVRDERYKVVQGVLDLGRGDPENC